MMERMIYAGYGANTNHAHMAQRCPGASYLGTGLLEHWRLEFRGVADVVPCFDAECEVALWEIGLDDLRALDRFEGYPRLYQRTELPVITDGSELELAIVYVMVAGRELATPHQSYHDALMSGYRDCDMRLDQIAKAVSRAEAEQCRHGQVYTSRQWGGAHKQRKTG